jgi:hypothetical protein
MITEDRLRAGLRDSAARLADVVAGSDDATRVPTCPDWSLRQLTTHVGRAHRWAGEMVNRRVTEMLPYREAPDGRLPDDPAARPRWLTAGAEWLIEAVGQAGDEPVWTFGGMAPAGFWLRRMTHETAVHAADAELAVGHLSGQTSAVGYLSGQTSAVGHLSGQTGAVGRQARLPGDLAVDAIDEWFEMVFAAGGEPPLAEGKTLHVHATDAGLDGGEWLVTRTASGLAVEHGHARADVAVRGPADRLLLVLVRRLPPAEPEVEVLGDAAVLGHWLEHTPF